MNTEPLLVVGAVALIAGSLERTGVKGGAGTGLREKAGEGARFGSGNRGARGGSRSARWAGRRDLNKLAVRAPEKGRVIVGKAGRSLIAAEAGQSVLVVGPTQSRKTTGFAIPALLEWQGPVVAASVKSDLLSQTIEWRGSQGRTWIYDPTRSTGRRCSSWSPIDASKDWAGSRRTAASLTEVARSSAGTLTDGDFWYATAAKLLAPLLLAASVSGGSMSDVVRWVDLQDVEEVESALSNAGEWAALQAAQATWARDPRQRSAVYSTAETVVDPFADPSVAATSRRDASSIDPVSLLGGSNTLYICSPAHDQRRLRPLFATLVGYVIECAFERVARNGAALDPPLLVLLDEAANVAPLAELDVLASTAAGHGIQIVSVWQDLAQITSRYGSRASTIVNNHRVKVFLSGIADTGTLEQASQLIGDVERSVISRTFDVRGGHSTTQSVMTRRLLPPDALRRTPPGAGVVISGHLPPAHIHLRPWYDDATLRARVETAR